MQRLHLKTWYQITEYSKHIPHGCTVVSSAPRCVGSPHGCPCREGQERHWLGEAMVAILDILSPPNQNLFDIWPVLAKHHFPCSPLQSFSYFGLGAIVAWPGHSPCSLKNKSDRGTTLYRTVLFKAMVDI